MWYRAVAPDAETGLVARTGRLPPWPTVATLLKLITWRSSPFHLALCFRRLMAPMVEARELPEASFVSRGPLPPSSISPPMRADLRMAEVRHGPPVPHRGQRTGGSTASLLRCAGAARGGLPPLLGTPPWSEGTRQLVQPPHLWGRQDP